MNNKINVGITIEARMSSTRLPGKSLRMLNGKPMLAQMIARLKRVRLADQIIIATTTNQADDPIAELAKSEGVSCYRGSEDDVLDRVLRAAQTYNVDLIVETCGDCPVIDPLLLDYEISTFLNHNVDYVGCHMKKTYPIGIDAKIFTTKTLEEVDRKTQEPADRENVSLYIYEHPEEYHLLNIEATGRFYQPDLRLVVDHLEDLQLMEKIFQEMEKLEYEFDYSDIIELFELNPDLKKINSGVINIQVAGRENEI